MIERLLYKSIEDKLFKGKIIVLLGARQVGKTTLLKQMMQKQEHVLHQHFFQNQRRPSKP